MAVQSVTCSSSPPPFVIVVPHAVLVELDGLKKAEFRYHQGRNNCRESVAALARQATNWLLAAVGRERKVVLSSNQTLPRHRMPLLIQTQTQAQEMSLDYRGVSVDENLVDVCLTLQKETSLPVIFCSNDNNARTRAEIEEVRTFDLDTVLRCSCSAYSEARKSAGDRSTTASRWSAGTPSSSKPGLDLQIHPLSEAPRLLLEQWNAQIQQEQDESVQRNPSVQNHNHASSLISPSARDEDESMDLDDQRQSQQPRLLDAAPLNIVCPPSNDTLPTTSPTNDTMLLNPTILLPTMGAPHKQLISSTSAASAASVARGQDVGISTMDSIYSSAPGSAPSASSSKSHRKTPYPSSTSSLGPASSFSPSLLSHGKATRSISSNVKGARSTADSIWASPPLATKSTVWNMAGRSAPSSQRRGQY